MLFNGSKLLHALLCQQKMPADDALKCAKNLQQLQQQQNVAPALVAAMEAGARCDKSKAKTALTNEGGWEAAAQALLAPPADWRHVNFHMLIKCVDALGVEADECKAARDLKSTHDTIAKAEAFLNGEENQKKTEEIRSGVIDKKKTAAAKSGVAISVELQAEWAAEAEKKVNEVLSKKQANIDNLKGSLEQKKKDVAASVEVQRLACVQRVWNACGAAAIQQEFQAVDRQARDT